MILFEIKIATSQQNNQMSYNNIKFYLKITFIIIINLLILKNN